MSADPQKSAVYSAECIVREMLERGGTVQVAGSTLTLPVERKFSRLEEVESYLNKIHGVFGVDLPKPRVRVRKGQQFAHYEWATNTLAFPTQSRWAFREMVVLHEYAHFLAWQLWRARSHGKEFQSEFRGLLDAVVGPEAAFLFGYQLAVSV